jgi:hypothetical protein
MHSPEDSHMTWIATADRWVGLKLAEVIGRDLRSLYSEVLHMPLPEHLIPSLTDRKRAFQYTS